MPISKLRGACVLTLLVAGATPLHAQAPPDRPLLRMQFLEQQRAYPFQEVPAGALQVARHQAELRWPIAFQANRPVPLAAAETGWRGLGPAPIADRDAGRLSTIAIDPRDPDVIYIGAAQGGVWKTVDGGQSWQPLTDDQCSLAMGSLLLDPVNPDIVYAGTGELHFSGDSYYGCGILRSTDGGQTWERLGASVFDTNTGGARISKILLDPGTAGSTTTVRLFAATSFGFFRSVDGGTTWTATLQGAVTDLIMDPGNANLLYAAVGFPQTQVENGIYRSTDGGVTWTRLGGGLPTQDVGRIALALAPSNPQILFAAVQDGFNNGGSDGQLLGIWKSTNGGTAWTKLAATNASCGFQCWYDLVIAVHPTNPDLVYFGGVDFYRSFDGGQTFANIRSGMHVDQHAIAFHPTNPDILFVGNDGGIFRSNSGGIGWTTLNTNLAITQFYAGVSLHPTNPDVIMGGTQDNGTLEYTGIPNWLQVLGGDGGFTAIDPLAPGTVYAEFQWQSGSSFSGPRRRTQGQGFFQLKTVGIDVNDRALFIPPLVMDPADPNVLYFGTYRLYRTANRADQWSAISPDLTNGGAISAIAPAPSSPQTVYVGTSDGRLQVTTNGGGNWALRNSGLPDRYVTDIAVDAFDAQRAIATVSGFGSGHVFRTTNGGAQWTDISANLPDVPVNAVFAHPSFAGDIYVGTDLGVFRSRDDGASWQPFNDGFPNVAVFDLAYNDGTGQLIAATHGRGIFAIQPSSISSVAVSPDALTFNAVGDTSRVTAVALDGSGAPLPDANFSWASLNADVATVDATGLVTARGNGATMIVAALGGQADSVRVTVTQTIVSLGGLADTTTLVRGERRNLTAHAQDPNGAPVPNAPISWVSRQPNVASVDAVGHVTALAVGETVIVAALGSLADSTRLRVVAPATVIVEPASPVAASASARKGTRIGLLRVGVHTDGPEGARVTRIGVDITGDDPLARVMMVHDVNGDGLPGADEPRLTQIVRGLDPDVPERISLLFDFAVQTGASATLIVAAEMSGAAPHGAQFRATFIPSETRTVGLLSGAQDNVDQPAQPFVAAPVATTTLDADQVVAISENPVRDGGVTFTLSATPTVAGVYTVTGRRVADLTRRVTGSLIEWDLTNDQGEPIGPGVYLVVFEVEGRVIRERLMVLR